MDKRNDTLVTEFILSGLTDGPQMKALCFVMFLLMYLVILIGNLGMIVLIRSASQLCTPMYFFLSHMSFLDLVYSSAVAPKMLLNLLTQKNNISYMGCAAQMFFFVFSASTECLLLAVMAYDRYVAICSPLLYMALMSPRVCCQLMASSYLFGFVNAMTQAFSTFRLSFCSSNIINHFFCDIPPLLALSCSDIHINKIVLSIFAMFLGLFTSAEILLSYVFIVSTILQIHSSEGKRKTFSTCASHLMAVSIFFGTTVFMYLRPSSSYFSDQDKWASMFYTVVIPMMNPLIYSLRNKEVKEALKKIQQWKLLGNFQVN
ncbi:olfactory receptor 1019-like [Alligator sinensis]|uniref:Olfactory receptor n=1 Tax=Alligator sinensis TaxID=38654 RepID=A0A1U7SQL1_ALLSI|nr:olfactory receptor 1019-like [Alligator sinensis]